MSGTLGTGPVTSARLGCARRPPVLLILLAGAIHFLLTGYEFATWDQVLYLPLINGYVNPSTFSVHDVYMQGFLAKTYTTLFLALTPFVQLAGWEWPVFLAYALVKLGFFWGCWALTFRLTRDHRAASLAVVFLVANTLLKNLSAQVPAATLICRYAVMPFLLFGLERLVARRFRTSALLFGLAFQIHALTTSFWIVVTALYVVLAGRRLWTGAGRQLRQAALIFAALVLPMVLWHGLTPTPFPSDLTVAEWMKISEIKHWYNFISRWPLWKWEDLLFSVVLVGISLPRLVRDGTWRPFVGLTLGALLVLGVHYVVSEVVLFRPLYQLQWIRVIDVPVFAGFIAIARVLAWAGRGRQRWVATLAAAALLTVSITGQRDLAVRGATLLACAALVWSEGGLLVPTLATGWAAAWLVFRPYAWSAFPPLWPETLALGWSTLQILSAAFAALAAFFLAQRLRQRAARGGLRALASVGLLALLLFASPPGRRRPQPQWRSGMFVKTRWERLALPGRALQASWFQLQLWIRANTPPGTLFFTPPGPLGFRVLSARSPFIEYADGEVGIFDPGLAREWKRRMELIGCWPPTVGRAAVAGAGQTYHAIPPERWLALARENHVDYLITSSPVQLPFPKLHAAGEYSLWRLPKGAERTPW